MGESEQKMNAAEWDLSDLYKSPDDPSLQQDRDDLLARADRFAETYRGRIRDLTDLDFRKALEEYEGLVEILRKIGSYSQLIWTTNTEDPQLGKLVQEARELGSEVRQKLAFFDVEWLKVDEKKAEEWIESRELEHYRHYLRVSRLYKEHTLEEGQEQVMAAKNVTGAGAWTRFFDETMGAARYRFEKEDLTQQEVLSKLYSADREVRRKAHRSLTEKLSSMSRTLTFVFNTRLADKMISDRLRGYDHWLDSRNLSNQIENESVENLVGSVTENYGLVQRYYRLKRRLLELDKLYDYDRYAPVQKIDRQITWEEAKEYVLDAFESFDPKMKQIAERFFDENWIDARIRPGKRGGAYSASTVTSVHPYIFMNFDGQLRDVQTLAHELGHGVHQYLARKQGELQSDTPLTTAETASVFAEMLVFEKMMEQLENPGDRLALLAGKIDDTIATVFRQVSMNRFENKIHTHRREKGELTKDQFSNYWAETQTDLYADSVRITDEYRLWWCYIPHFLHTPGYVYAYAFGELLVMALYQSWKEESTGFSENYLKMLEAGGSDWPHNLVAEMGLDIKDPEFWLDGLKLFERQIRQAEELEMEITQSRS